MTAFSSSDPRKARMMTAPFLPPPVPVVNTTARLPPRCARSLNTGCRRGNPLPNISVGERPIQPPKSSSMTSAAEHQLLALLLVLVPPPRCRLGSSPPLNWPLISSSSSAAPKENDQKSASTSSYPRLVMSDEERECVIPVG
jgi:hypothetical protein